MRITPNAACDATTADLPISMLFMTAHFLCDFQIRQSIDASHLNGKSAVPSAQHNKNAEAKTQKSGGVVPPDFLASQHTNLTRPA